ncbi:SAM-dependent methyltransferase [Natronobacillus azotifigens]|uniref:Methyltransferase domain-containing protein n=1 Tax=Natronobacillus azotifigens TaxID=472978 RepID=A0A9J6RDD0_9BACI|nr:methyltransferase domain-containing protein [Natronobacillus azotifigens]MCZ0703688.1 methyltransferase domain-containing protein [Natronobacillus azotifigens]
MLDSRLNQELNSNQWENYWPERSNMIYYQYINLIVKALARDCNSLLDVGSNKANYIEEFDWIEDRTTIDIDAPYFSKNVKGIKQDFIDFTINDKFDFVTCLQVLEHVPNPDKFAQKLFEMSDRVLISVPYMWPENSTEGHIQDPVDYDKLKKWTRREPLYSIVVEEPLDDTQKSKRLICYYTQESTKISLKQARKHIRSMDNNQVINTPEGKLLNNIIEGQSNLSRFMILDRKIRAIDADNQKLKNKIQVYSSKIAKINKRMKKHNNELQKYKRRIEGIRKSKTWSYAQKIRRILNK